MKFIRRVNVVRLVFLVLIFLGLGALVLERRMSNREQDRLRQYEPTAGVRVKDFFDKAGVPFPPARVTFVGLKTERKLQVYASGGEGALRFVHEYPIQAASGQIEPKLQEGDNQVPEGIYKINSLNPNSLYHLALRVGYPNDWDQEHARTDGRKKLGGDIMIHGGAGSCGCLAMGDPVAEDLFVLAARTGVENVRIVLCPVDFRLRDIPSPSPHVPAWTGQLYNNLKSELAQLPEPKDLE